MLEVTIRDETLRRVLKDLDARGQNMATSLQATMQKRLMIIGGIAENKAPIAEGSLRRSEQARAFPVGNMLMGQIQFGGLAEAYASVQHEHDEFAHTEAEYLAKYGKPLGRTNRAGKLSRTTYQRFTLRGSVTKFGKLVVKQKAWTYKHTHRTGPQAGKHFTVKGYRGGQAHFLYGRSDSAWTPATEQALLNELLTRAQQEMLAVMQGGRGD